MKPSWRQMGSEHWERGEIREAIRCYEKSFMERNASAGIWLFLAILYLMTGQRVKAMEVLGQVKRWNPFDFTAREIERRALDIMEKSLQVVRFPHVVGWFFSDGELPHEEYVSRFQRMDYWVGEITRYARRVPFASVVLGEIVGSVVPVSRGEVVLRPLLPKVEIALGFWSEGVVIHEIAHVLYPSTNLFLTEGLSLFLQERLSGGDKGWPFMEARFQDEVEDSLVEDLVAESIFSPRFFTMENISTGEAVGFYKLAWKWVSHLIEKRGMGSFLDLYDATVYGDEDVRGMFVHLYGTGDLWLKEKKRGGGGFHMEEEVPEGDISDKKQRLDVWETEWQRTHEALYLRRLCGEGMAFVSYLWGCTFGGEGNNPLSGVFQEYMKKMEIWLKEALRTWSDEPSLHCMLADLYGMQMEFLPVERRMAIGLLMHSEVKKALALDPSHQAAKMTLGRILLFTPKIFGGGTKKAGQCFAEVLAQNPEHVDALAWEAYADWTEGKTEMAREKWKRVLVLKPGHLFASRMLDKPVEREDKQPQ